MNKEMKVTNEYDKMLFCVYYIDFFSNNQDNGYRYFFYLTLRNLINYHFNTYNKIDLFH